MRILVIDDEPLVADVIAEALRLEDNHVVVASSGEEGLRAIEQNPPDAVFLDIVMPGMDGIEVLRAIREAPPAARDHPLGLGEPEPTRRGATTGRDRRDF